MQSTHHIATVTSPADLGLIRRLPRHEVDWLALRKVKDSREEGGRDVAYWTVDNNTADSSQPVASHLRRG